MFFLVQVAITLALLGSPVQEDQILLRGSVESRHDGVNVLLYREPTLYEHAQALQSGERSQPLASKQANPDGAYTVPVPVVGVYRVEIRSEGSVPIS